MTEDKCSLKPLTEVPVGKYPCRKWWQFWKTGGWLSVQIDDDCGTTSVYWTSDEDSHFQMLFGPAFVVDVSKDGELTAFYETAITLWMRWGYGKRDPKQYERGMDIANSMMQILCNKEK